VPVTARRLVGRENELGAIVGLLDAADQLPATALLAGDAGIGKTSVWLAGIDCAASRGYRVLSSRPSEAETGLSFAGLADLLGDAVGGVLPRLPPVQRRALEAALLLGESTHADERTVAAAFLGALGLLTDDGPLCLAVDDVQWLDAASVAALRFALARLNHQPVAALLAVRGDLPNWLRRAVPEERLRTVEVGGLSVGAIHELLRTRLDATFSRPTLIRLWETSAGNPFFALQLATALQRRGGSLAPGEELPIPSDLDELLHERLEGLGAAALEVARAVAALADPTLALVEAALGARLDRGLAEALAARILELDGPRLRFTHPLLASAVAARQTPARRRSLHARLADVVPSAEERARHLALATAGPDGDVASLLEGAARAAHARGAPPAAAELAEQALRLTPLANVEDARRRLLFAADRHHAAGDSGRAVALLGRARAAAAVGVERAVVLVALAGVQPDTREALTLYRQALAEAEGDLALEATIQLHLAELMRFSEGVEPGFAHAELAVRAASRTDDVALRCRVLATYGLLHFNSGRGIPRAEMDEALALERTLPEGPLIDGPFSIYCYQLTWSDDLNSARRHLLDLRAVLETRNEAAAEAETLWFLAFAEWRAGNWEESGRYAAAMWELTTQLGRATTPEEFPAALLAAHRGEITDARDRAQRALGRAEVEGSRMVQSFFAWLLGFIELSLGDATAALTYLRAADELRDGFLLEPAQRMELGDLLEALIAAGELDEAEEVCARWQERADTLEGAWALAILARGRGLLLAARGDHEGAFTSFERALAEHDRGSDPFQHARTLLALGRTQRRAKKRGAARTTLEDALARFEHLGARLWAEQARAELARIPGRLPSRGELTEGERRIAALAADGRTNREVASALFLTEHSVETVLSRVYRKLGLRSRTELASRLAREEEDPRPKS